MAVKDDGTIVVVTPCQEGISKTHKELLSIAGLEAKEIRARLQAGEIKDKSAAANSFGHSLGCAYGYNRGERSSLLRGGKSFYLVGRNRCGGAHNAICRRCLCHSALQVR